ncbi:hypothetical protein NS228_18510 [Methylobacterium indicum]|uniref:hypothetical protein n=1 Tax=Methylobacterium indicum TaxID=1775910 RepID=UPI000734A1BD|nr:hypothetical protein [Methylobacterium indicum]KTS37693.1 hypothetical protein NS228_18510 [Methylobacterium indicum]KTS39114.1 hypothetical protein NS229_01475 [Methylobacterium indicum]KTS51737.1 hypothetical protein NS230_13360 [Methylobacterium indicum]
MIRSALSLAALVGLAVSPAQALDPTKSGRYGRGDADSLDVGGAANVGSLTAMGRVTAGTVQIRGTGSSGPIDGMTVGGKTLATQMSPQGWISDYQPFLSKNVASTGRSGWDFSPCTLPGEGCGLFFFQRPRDGVTGNPGQSIRIEKWADYQTNVGEEDFNKSKTLVTIKTRLYPQTRQHEIGLSVNMTQVNPVGGNSAAYLSAYRGRSDAGYGFGPDGNPVPSNDANPPARVMGRNGTVTNWGSHGDVYPLVVEGRDYVRNPSQGAAAAEFDLWAIGEDRNKKRGGINMVLGPIPGVNDAHPQPAGYIVPQFDYGVQVGAQHGIRNFANVGYAYHVGAGIYSNLLGSRANSDQISVVNGVDLRNISLTGRAFASNNFEVDGQGNLNANTFSAGGSSGATCAAGEVVLAKLVIKNGIITQCK